MPARPMLAPGVMDPDGPKFPDQRRFRGLFRRDKAARRGPDGKPVIRITPAPDAPAETADTEREPQEPIDREGSGVQP